MGKRLKVYRNLQKGSFSKASSAFSVSFKWTLEATRLPQGLTWPGALPAARRAPLPWHSILVLIQTSSRFIFNATQLLSSDLLNTPLPLTRVPACLRFQPLLCLQSPTTHRVHQQIQLGERGGTKYQPSNSTTN